MTPQPSFWRSLKTRVTLFTLAMFVLGMIAVTVLTGRMLHLDLQALLERQQFDTAGRVAGEVDQEMTLRLHALELEATGITPALLGNAAALQRHLQARPALQALFNGGTFVVTAEGTALASLPESAARSGINYRSLDYIAAALTGGAATIGQPTRGKLLHSPVLHMAAPLRDARGQLTGALAGVIDLGQPNFLDPIFAQRDGQNVSYVLVDRTRRQIVTATDKTRSLEALPALGVNAVADQFLSGFEGAAIGVAPTGQSVLVAAKNVPVANWYVAAHLPTAEAFAPINALQQRVIGVTALLTLLATLFTGWMLRRQLLPLVTTARTLAALPAGKAFPTALPITRDDEIGQLIAGFNQLLQTLAQREATLKESEERFRTLTEWTPEALMVHRNGKLLYANPAAARLLGAQVAQELLNKTILELVHPDWHDIVIKRLELCQATGADLPMIEQKYLRLDGSSVDVEVSSTAMRFDGQPAVQTAARDISARKRADAALKANLRDKEVLLNEVHHRVKNNLQVIGSLLRLQAGRSSQPETKSALHSMQGRIRTMALLHETLYRSGIFATVNLADYLKLVATQVVRAQDNGSHRLQLALQAVHVSIDQANPCGLLVSELVTNCLKHAFPSGQRGEIHISLCPTSQDAADEAPGGTKHWCLTVSDNGVGLPADFALQRTNSLGLQLATDLARQLGGTLTIGSNGVPGSSFGVIFAVVGVA